MSKNLRIGLLVVKLAVAALLLTTGRDLIRHAERGDATSISAGEKIADTIDSDRAMIGTVGRSVRGCFYGLVAVCVMLIPIPSEPSRVEPAGKV